MSQYIFSDFLSYFFNIKPLTDFLFFGKDYTNRAPIPTATNTDLGCEVESDLDFYKYLKGIAEIYQEYLENEFGGTFTIDEIYSPKEYNFETDTIILSWEKENLSETQMQKLLDDKFEALDDSELNDIETYDIYDHFYGYELYDSLNRFYVIDEQGNEKDIYFDNEKECYVAE